jgi:hypothetical protein
MLSVLAWGLRRLAPAPNLRAAFHLGAKLRGQWGLPPGLLTSTIQCELDKGRECLHMHSMSAPACKPDPY